MTKDVLIQYADLQEEIKDIRRRMEKTESRLTRIRQEGTVIDSVTGTRADGTIGHIRIEGFPYAAHDKQSTHLRLYAAQLAEREERLLEQTNAVEAYINSITDSRMRRIIQYRILDRLSWYEVADKIGGKATSDSCRIFRKMLKCSASSF